MTSTGAAIALDLFGGPAFVAVQFGHLAHELGPVVGSRCNLDVGLLPYGPFERLDRVARVFEHLRVKTVAPVRGAAGVHDPFDERGMSHGEFETDGATHAVANDVDECDADRLQQRGDVVCHVRVGQWTDDVGGAAVTLQLDSNHAVLRGERREQPGEAALDCAHRAVQQNERGAVAVGLVVELEPVDRRVAAVHSARLPFAS
jgi:hypothetical protein